jgi:hypothetical protein
MDTNFATLNIDRPQAHVMLVTLNRSVWPAGFLQLQ